MRRKYTQSRVIVVGLNSQWDIDLMDMTDPSKQNDGVKYVVVAIDIFSRFSHCQPVSSKQEKDTLQALKLMFSETPQPKPIRSGMGQ